MNITLTYYRRWSLLANVVANSWLCVASSLETGTCLCRTVMNNKNNFVHPKGKLICQAAHLLEELKVLKSLMAGGMNDLLCVS